MLKTKKSKEFNRDELRKFDKRVAALSKKPLNLAVINNHSFIAE